MDNIQTFQLPEETVGGVHALADALAFDYTTFWQTTTAYQRYVPAQTRTVLEVRKIYGYVRQSLDQFGDKLGVDRQKKEIRARVPLLSAQEVAAGRAPLELVEIIEDESNSASDRRKKRPGWQRLWELAEAGVAHGIIAYHPDRMYRVLYDLEDLINLAERKDLFLATCSTTDLDLRTPEGKVQARLLGTFARYEMERKAARQRLMHNQRAEIGIPWAQTRPFGYSVVKDANGKVANLKRHEPEATLIQEAFDQVLAGKSLKSICREWNELGMLTTRGNVVGRKIGSPWTTATLSRTLKNPVYCGMRTRNVVDPNTGKPEKAPELFRGLWTGLIDPEQHSKVIAYLEGRDIAGVKTVGKHLLSQLMQCGACLKAGNPKHKLVAGQTRGVGTYRCESCSGTSRNRAAMDEWVLRLVRSRLQELQDRGGVLGDDSEQTLLALQAKLTKTRDRTRVLVARQNDEATKMDDEDWDVMYQGRRRVQQELEAEIATMRVMARGEVSSDPAAAWAKAETLAERRAVIRQLCPVIVLLPGGRGRPRAGEGIIRDHLVLTDQRQVDRWLRSDG